MPASARSSIAGTPRVRRDLANLKAAAAATAGRGYLLHRGRAGERRLRRAQRVLRERARLCVRDRGGAARGIPRGQQGGRRAAGRRRRARQHVRPSGRAEPAANTANGRSCGSTRSTTRSKASRRIASAITSASAAGTCRMSRTRAGGHRRPDPAGERRRLFDRGRQRAPRARMARLGEGEAAGRQDPDPGRRHAPHHDGRASAAGRRPHHQFRQAGRPRERDRRHRLRLRPGRDDAARPPAGDVGEVREPRRRRAARQQGVVGLGQLSFRGAAKAASPKSIAASQENLQDFVVMDSGPRHSASQTRVKRA